MTKKFATLLVLAVAARSPAPAVSHSNTTSATITATSAGLKPAEVIVGEGLGRERFVLFAPLTGAHVKSPAIVTGAAPANWFFEAQFHAELIGANGKTIVEAPAIAQEDWTNGKPTHPFRAELAFRVAADTSATLLLREDMPPDADSPEPSRPTREIRIPVTLAAH